MFREIIAKTLIGKGRYANIDVRTIKLKEEASKTLGCWIINHSYEAYKDKEEIKIKGQYEIQLWYAVDNDQKTSVYNEVIPFESTFAMSWRKLKVVNDQYFLKVYVVKYPTAIDMTLQNSNEVVIKIESGYLLDVFSEAVLMVDVKEDEMDDSEVMDDIIMNVNPNYLEEKK